MPHFSLSEPHYYAADTLFKVVGLAALVISAFFAWTQFNESRDRDFRKTIFERQISVITDVYSVMTEIDTARSEDSRKIAGNKFWVIYYGSARTFLTPRLNESLAELPSEYVATCVSKFDKPKLIKDCASFSAAMSVTGFSRTAREELAKTWGNDLGQFGKENPWVLGSQK